MALLTGQARKGSPHTPSIETAVSLRAHLAVTAPQTVVIRPRQLVGRVTFLLQTNTCILGIVHRLYVRGGFRVSFYPGEDISLGTKFSFS